MKSIIGLPVNDPVAAAPGGISGLPANPISVSNPGSFGAPEVVVAAEESAFYRRAEALRLEAAAAQIKGRVAPSLPESSQARRLSPIPVTVSWGTGPAPAGASTITGAMSIGSGDSGRYPGCVAISGSSPAPAVGEGRGEDSGSTEVARCSGSAEVLSKVSALALDRSGELLVSIVGVRSLPADVVRRPPEAAASADADREPSRDTGRRDGDESRCAPGEADEPSEPVESAKATGIDATADPIPNATASAPTRPT